MHVAGPKKIGGISKIFQPPEFLRIPAIGIDLSDRSLKYMFLRRQGNIVTPEKYGKYEIPQGVLEHGNIKNPKALIEIIKQVQRDAGISYAYISLPEEHGYLFQMELDNDLEPREVRDFVEFNLQGNVPLAPEQAVFDYQLIPKTKSIQVKPFASAHKRDLHTDDEKNIDELHMVSVSAYPRNIINEYVSVFEKGGFLPLAFEIEAQAAARAVVPAGHDGTYMIVDLGKTNAGLSIIHRGAIISTATLAVGGDDFSSAIRKRFSVSHDEAEVMKNEKGFINSKENKELYQSLFTTMSVLKDELKKHYSYWESQLDSENSPDNSVEQIIMCGGNSNLVGLPEYLEISLGIPTVRADVWVNVLALDQIVPEIDEAHSLEYSTAIGLALRHANK